MCVWNLRMELSSFGIESMDTWFGTLYFVYGLKFGNSQTHFLLGLS